MFDLKGKTALVTGATGGIGAAIARVLHKQGATVALNEVWEKGGAGGIELANAVLNALAAGGSHYRPLYDPKNDRIRA